MVLKFEPLNARVLIFPKNEKFSAGSYKTGSYKRRLCVPGIFCLTVKQNHPYGLPSSAFLGEVVMAGHTIE